MAQIVKIDGQRLDLDANPDLLYHLLVSVTNIEEHLSSIDKRLYNLEKKMNENNKNNKSHPYLIKKKL